MALELRTFVDVLTETDEHNKHVVKTLTDRLKKATVRTKTQRTWQLKTTNQVRRQKTMIKRMNETIDAQDTDYVDLKARYDALVTEHDALLTEHTDLTKDNDELHTELITMTMDHERDAEDIRDINARLADHSCPWCGSPTPAPVPARSTSSTGTQTTTPAMTVNKHFMPV